MKHREQWKPGKFVYRRGRLAASRDTTEVSVVSRLVTDLIAGRYHASLGKYASGRLLDLGCGKVPLYGAYKNLVTDNTCVDWGNSLHDNPFLDQQCDLTQPLPFSDGEYNTVILSDVLEHIPEPGHLMGEIARVLASGGTLIMNVPFMYWLHEEPYDYYRYTSFTLRRLAESAGLEVKELEPIGGALCVFTDIYAKNIIRLPMIGRALAVLAQWSTGAVIRTWYGRKLFNATAKKFPLGYFMVAVKN